MWKQFAAAGGADLLVDVIRDDPGGEEAARASKALGIMCAFDQDLREVARAADGQSVLREFVAESSGSSADVGTAALRRCGMEAGAEE